MFKLSKTWWDYYAAATGSGGDGSGRDGVVEGTSGDDRIDIAYTGDPEGDRIDNGDAVLPGAGPDDDVVVAREGDDTVEAGRGDDLVFGGSGSDTISGGAGNDTLIGGGPDRFGDNLIDNGSFEDTTGTTATSYGAVGTGGVPGWTTDDPDAEVDLHSDERGGVEPTDGEYWADLDASPGNIRIGQTVDGIADGERLALTFDAGDAEGGDNTFSVIWNGERLELDGSDRIDPVNGDMQSYTFVVEGGSGDGSNRLEFEGDGDNDYVGVSIDNVALRSMGNLEDDGAADVINGDAGDDVIYGGGGDDTLSGGAGNDTIYGGAGNDRITGDGGGDGAAFSTMHSDPQDEGNLLYGGDDRDTFHGFDGVGQDTVYGGDGGDDYDTLDLRGSVGREGSIVFENVRTDSDGNGFDGTARMLDGDGNQTGEVAFRNIENIIPCFTPGTRIATPRGEVLVEHLQVGDKVITRDNGIQEVRWVGQRPMNWRALEANPHLKPILVRQGALGNGLPERDMMVSPQHRLLVANERTALYFEEHEVLVAAKHLVDHRSIKEIASSGTTYVHFMCDRHEVVLSDGAWTETFQPGDYTLKGMGNAQRIELFELFPELQEVEGREAYAAARKTLKRHEAQLLL